MSAASLHGDLAAVAAALAEAGAQADTGALVDLSGLDARVATLCEAAEALPRDAGQALLPDLEAMIAALNALDATLSRQRALSDGTETHAARQRAAAVYRRPSDSPIES